MCFGVESSRVCVWAVIIQLIRDFRPPKALGLLLCFAIVVCELCSSLLCRSDVLTPLSSAAWAYLKAVTVSWSVQTGSRHRLQLLGLCCGQWWCAGCQHPFVACQEPDVMLSFQGWLSAETLSSSFVKLRLSKLLFVKL